MYYGKFCAISFSPTIIYYPILVPTNIFLLTEPSGISLGNRLIAHKKLLQAISPILKKQLPDINNIVVINFRMSTGLCLCIVINLFSPIPNQ